MNRPWRQKALECQSQRGSRAKAERAREEWRGAVQKAVSKGPLFWRSTPLSSSQSFLFQKTLDSDSILEASWAALRHYPPNLCVCLVLLRSGALSALQGAGTGFTWTLGSMSGRADLALRVGAAGKDGAWK